jgi:hypothetical protein
MVFDGLRAYLQLANGLTDVTKARAMATARSLVQQSEAGVATVVPEQLLSQVTALAEDLLATSRANRDLLVGLVRVEVERSVGRLGLVSAAELEAASARAQLLLDRVQELERSLRAAQARATTGTREAPSAAPAGTGTTATAKKSTAKKATAQKASARPADAAAAPAPVAANATAEKATTKKALTRKASTGKATVSKATVRKATASKATSSAAPVAKKASARKAAGSRARKATG